MAGNTRFVYADSQLVKTIADPDSVRLKVCPMITRQEHEAEEYAEHERVVGGVTFAPVEVSMDRVAVNRLIADLKAMRNRTFGKDS